MRRIASFIPASLAAILLVAGSSCTDSEAHEPLFGGDLSATNFVVDPSKDTVLKTPGGALIAISAGSLDAGDAPTVTLEVKEALTPADMTRGGLSSTALTSNGMIYINVTGGQAVTIHKALNISLPGKEGGNDWMLYKASAGEDGLLKWGDERPLVSSPGGSGSGGSSDAGKALFESKCASCHGGREESVGPPLAWIGQRRERQWLYAFTRNNATLLWRGDAYTCYLFNRYKTPMPLFRDLSDDDLANLYRYIDKASRLVDSTLVPDGKRSFDSCVNNDPNCGGVAGRTKVVTAADAPLDSASAAPSPVPSTDYYTFAVDKHGWYSVARRAGSGTVAAAVEFPAVADSVHAAPQSMKACPCWCDESAYRRADSLGRARQ